MNQKRVCLSNGTKIAVRQIRPDGAKKLAEGFSQLSPNSRKLRFLTSRGDFTTNELQHMVECDGVTALSLVAVILDESELEAEAVAVAHFFRDPMRPQYAEFAIAVLDQFQKIGIGSALLSELVLRAKLVGITHWTGICSSDNIPIQKLMSRIGRVELDGYRDSAMVFEIELF